MTIQALERALELAEQFVGATAPNPPVGAAAIDAQGHILSVQAHERAGTGHAEAKVLQDLESRGELSKIHTLVVTLEPCNHQGRTPPCTDAILRSSVRRVIYGTPDPNPRVAGQGAQRLREAGVDIQLCPDSKLRAACKELIRPFCHWSRTGLPWVVIKTAWTEDGGTPTMIPPPGQKTFTSAESLTLAHLLRRRADAILTGSGTILADWPEFTVRHLPEHQDILNKNKKRIITILDRRGRVPAKWLQEAQNRGLEVLVRPDLEEALSELGQRGVLEVLVEAGPALAAALLSKSLWNKHVLITQGKSGKPDQVRIEENVHWHHPKSRDC